jgi:hypothetical protein
MTSSWRFSSSPRVGIPRTAADSALHRTRTAALLRRGLYTSASRGSCG